MMKLKLIKYGLLDRALGLEEELMRKLRKSRVGVSLRGDDDDDESKGKNKKYSRSSGSSKNIVNIESVDNTLEDILGSINREIEDLVEVKLTAHSRTIYKNLRKYVLSELSVLKCQNCGYTSNKLRKDGQGGGKIFKCVLNVKARESNAELKYNAIAALELENRLAQKGIEVKEYAKRLAGGSALWRILNSEQDDESDVEDDNFSDPTSAKTESDEYMNPLEIQAQVKLTWTLYPSFCSEVFGDGGLGHGVFFMNTVCVPPSRFRPPMTLGSMTAEHAQNAHFEQLLKLNLEIRKLRAMYSSNMSSTDDGLKSSEKGDGVVENTSKILQNWIALQNTVNLIISDEKDGNGIRQILERKEGMFRKHMMGKRVNFACRSVIAPDPYLKTNEIGIPRKFAQRLTLPTPVNCQNITQMRQLINNGAKSYPGANWVDEFICEGGSSRKRRINLELMNELNRQALASRVVGNGSFIVGRQVVNGDRLLLNRQPTLHKPGIMAHVARVHTSNEQVLRMHYANCNTYNADFDGDEMNAHLVQSPLAQAEARLIMGAELQYVSGTDGGVLRGLIQDHVDAGVKLTHPSTFLTKEQYQQFVYAALVDVIGDDDEIVCEHACIRMPKRGLELWTGKQVVSTILHHLTPKLFCIHKTKTSPALLGYGHDKVLIIDGEILRGILDKNAFGSSSFGLIHSIHEAYGAEAASTALSVLGRLFTYFLQSYSGHSCRMEDLILTDEANDVRMKLIKNAVNVGARSSLEFARSDGGKSTITPVEDLSDSDLLSSELSEASIKLKGLLTGPEGAHNSAALDSHMQSVVNPLASKIIKACLPSGLECPFPHNTFGLMVNTGAKGSMVNQSQVSCCLGSQALEGRRVPRMSSGKTLPSFPPYCATPRADGFISDRFLTGVRPQEYYFHCMAGREGLVDTAVKTSRSGYLQRCLVKHLEELKVCYDNTVRDAESNVIQFLYGEDGIDPTKAAYLEPKVSTLEYLARNYGTLSKLYTPLPNSSLALSSKIAKQAKQFNDIKDTEHKDLKVGMFIQAKKLRKGNEWKRGRLCVGWFDATIIKVHSDKTYSIKYHDDQVVVKRVPLEVSFDGCASRRSLALWNICQLIRVSVSDPLLSGVYSGPNGFSTKRVGQSGSCISEKLSAGVELALDTQVSLEKAIAASGISSNQFEELVASKYANSLISPGEAVGSIAAQSVGEPSTQMTLNTFHLAGAGANVTLGIPRLREIIMTASRELKTPTMSVPFLPDISEKIAKRVSREYTKLTVKELISSHAGITVRECLEQNSGTKWDRSYYIKLKMHPQERIIEAFGLTLKDVAGAVTKTLIPKLAAFMRSEAKRANSDVTSLAIEGGKSSEYIDLDENSVSDKKKVAKKKSKNDDEYEDEEAGDEDGVMGSRFGHRKEMVSYEEMDDEDKAISTQQNNLFADDSDSDDEPTRSALPTVTDDEDESFTFSSNAVKIDETNNTIILRPLKVDPSSRSFLMIGLVERAAAATVVSSRKGIDQAFVNKEDGRGLCLQTAGVNFEEMWKLDEVDHRNLLSNDIWAIRCAYGVEAARMSIVDQIRGVFAVYGITVDPRHLSLIADYMTYDGDFKAMNRLGMANDSSAFVQMSFETTAVFLTEAALTLNKEILESPSANIVLGKPIKHGTGAFDCFVK
jgi:DNA-directed RNA polymerase I subunit RPA1